MATMGRCRGNTSFFASHNQFLQVFSQKGSLKGQDSSGMGVSVNCQERAYSSSISPSGINLAIPHGSSRLDQCTVQVVNSNRTVLFQ